VAALGGMPVLLEAFRLLCAVPLPPPLVFSPPASAPLAAAPAPATTRALICALRALTNATFSDPSKDAFLAAGGVPRLVGVFQHIHATGASASPGLIAGAPTTPRDNTVSSTAVAPTAGLPFSGATASVTPAIATVPLPPLLPPAYVEATLFHALGALVNCAASARLRPVVVGAGGLAATAATLRQWGPTSTRIAERACQAIAFFALDAASAAAAAAAAATAASGSGDSAAEGGGGVGGALEALGVVGLVVAALRTHGGTVATVAQQAAMALTYLGYSRLCAGTRILHGVQALGMARAMVCAVDTLGHEAGT